MTSSFAREVLFMCHWTEPDILADGCNCGLVGFGSGHEAVDDGPELGGVVRLSEVGEFVD